MMAFDFLGFVLADGEQLFFPGTMYRCLFYFILFYSYCALVWFPYPGECIIMLLGLFTHTF